MAPTCIFPASLHSPNMYLLCQTFLYTLRSLKHCAAPTCGCSLSQSLMSKTGYEKPSFFHGNFCGSTKWTALLVHCPAHACSLPLSGCTSHCHQHAGGDLGTGLLTGTGLGTPQGVVLCLLQHTEGTHIRNS